MNLQEEAIKILRKSFERAKLKYPNENWKEWEEASIEIELIAEAMSEYASSKWISVKDRLPEHGQRIIVFGIMGDTEKRVYTALFRHADKWNAMSFMNSGYNIIDVTHWMPLPEWLKD